MKWELLPETHHQPSVCPKGGGKVALGKKKKSKVDSIIKERKMSRKIFPSAAGELWLPVLGNCVALCGCESVMHLWYSRPPPPPLSRHSATPQWVNHCTFTKRKKRIKRQEIRNEKNKNQGKNKEQKQMQKQKITRMRPMTDHRHTTGTHTAPDGGKTRQREDSLWQTPHQSIRARSHITHGAVCSADDAGLCDLQNKHLSQSVVIAFQCKQL